MRFLHECLYEVGWQVCRLQCVGQWNTDEGVKRSLRRLAHYFADASREPEEMGLRIWRITTLLSAVVLRYRQMGWDHEDTRFARVAADLDSYAGLSFVYPMVIGEWDWGKVALDLTTVSDTTLKGLVRNIGSRARDGVRKGSRALERRRPEMVRFMELLHKEVTRREHDKQQRAV